MIVRQISAALGAEITEVDLAKVSDDQVEAVSYTHLTLPTTPYV